ncbi:SDR family NAD(P)-dependent oxidoreductase [Azotobacter beijerinckii]|uniref:NADP-dependent 3-hydroxy acid dehydrogenase YdfG n=1 Tax=Azotobacter beijerinckii TaxID=170623 RepID=A0A1I4FYN2_9GAMM|nr:SDR family NAD(P)-dependent oxidoreductase [Azotobacter beijerinckii]SFB54118.1 NADP-dependent 3-hydroxy acid dehydrogenase YdfG [Azotobacter beijerinckii]SFL21896.1 NADP-dependent 3-hydroxy acid dehydrogenase YdfG [Azotobacter beijerinckii]
MSKRTWFITGVSSGFGRQITGQLLERGDCVVGTVRDTGKVTDLIERYPEAFHAEVLEVTDTAAIRELVERSFARLGRIDVFIGNAGYGLFGAAEELTDEQVEHIVATNLIGSIQLIRAALPHLRAQGGGRIIQISSYGGQVAFPGNSMYHATKWGIEGFVESVAQEVASLRDRHDDRRARRRAHRVPLRERAGGGTHACLQRHPGTRLPADARSPKRSGPR